MNGECVSCIGSKGNFSLQFVRPNCRISVFTTTGEFVHCFGKGVIGYPTGSAIDKYGYLYVCDNVNDDRC